MDLAKHCALCDNQKSSLKEGTVCGLTDLKPEFNLTCKSIKLSDKFESALKSINIEYEKISRTKSYNYAYFTVYTLSGIAIIFLGYFLGKFALDGGVISTIPLIIMGLSITPFGIGSSKLIKYRQAIIVAKNKKDKIDEILELYNIKYDIEVNFGKEFHGTKEITANLTIKR